MAEQPTEWQNETEAAKPQNRFVRMGDQPFGLLPSGVRASVLTLAQMSVVYAVIEPGVSSAPHAHDHEQLGIVLEGEVDYTIAGETCRLKAGDGFFIPSNVVHSVVGIERAVTFEVFAPPRDDYSVLGPRVT